MTRTPTIVPIGRKTPALVYVVVACVLSALCIPSVVEGNFAQPTFVNNCTARPSRIILGDTYCVRGAGILDRWNVMNFIAAAADASCAQISLGSPGRLLRASHNKGRKPCAWSEYFQFKEFADGFPVRVPGGRVKPVGKVFSPKHTASRWRTQSRHVARAHKVGQTFTWIVDGCKFWNLMAGNVKMDHEDVFHLEHVFKGRTVNSLQGQYVHWSLKAKNVALRLKSIHGLKEGEYIALHVRRTDTAKMCDTTVSTVEAYARCKLGTIKQAMDTGNRTKVPTSTLIVFTDETESEYLSALQRALQKHFDKVLFGDEIIRTLVGEEEGCSDNYFDFIVSLQIRQESIDQGYAMHYGRGFCPKQGSGYSGNTC